MITLLIVYGLNNVLVAAVSGWLWHAKGWQSGYHEGAHDGVRQIMAQRPIKRPAEPADPGTGVARSTGAGDVLRGTAGQPERGAGADDARAPNAVSVSDVELVSRGIDPVKYGVLRQSHLRVQDDGSLTGWTTEMLFEREFSPKEIQ
jgi:hypothetical protein